MMESVLLTTSMKFPDDISAKLFTAVKFDEFYLASGSTFVSYVDHSVNHNLKAQLPELYDLKVWAVVPQNHSQHLNMLFHLRRVFCLAVYHNEFVKNTLDTVVNGLEFKDPSYMTSKQSYDILGSLILFSENVSPEMLEQGLQKLYGYISPVHRKMIGSPAAVISTPFKSLSLLNTYSQGVISNVFGKENCLLLVDVKLAPGCDGSPLFSLDGHLIGMILKVLTWMKGEWTGFSLAVHLHPLVRLWLQSHSPKLYSFIIEKGDRIEDLEMDSYGVVVISTPAKWGSGIVVNVEKGIILTCSHIVDFSTETRITVEYTNKSYLGKVVYATVEDTPFDLAVIQVHGVDFKDIRKFKEPARPVEPGEMVYVIGYPLFSIRKHCIKGASITCGHVSKIYPDIMLITSCVSNSGASGAALVRPNGELLGIVSNNMVVRDGGLLVPHITVVIPSSVFLLPVQRFCTSDNIDHLSKLTSYDRTVRDIWQLTFTATIIKSKL